MLGELSERLISGGYSADTPAAIVYKATWSDEKVCRCTVGTLAETAKNNGIAKTALITVGDFLGDIRSLSRLYSADFETGYRKATK
jgi:precorrin-4/cobalt-precorrin-4 C11-methyltransferase